MSYDYPDGYEPGPPVRMTIRDRVAHKWWGFVLWAALEEKPRGLRWLNAWGMKKLNAR